MRVEALAVLLLTASLAGCLGGEGGPTEAGPTATNGSDENPPDGQPNGTSSDEEASDEGSQAEANRTRSNRSSSNATGPPPGTVIAEGTIRAGSWTSSNFRSTASATTCQVEGAESFCFQDPPVNVTVETRTNTSSPRFNIDIWFHSDESGFIGGCDEGRSSPIGGAGDETNCTVPPEADWGTVDATFGVNLSVELVVAQPQADGG